MLSRLLAALHLQSVSYHFLSNPLDPINPYITQGQNTQELILERDQRILHKLEEPVPVRLLMKEELATDTFVYRFELPDAERSLGHATC